MDSSEATLKRVYEGIKEKHQEKFPPEAKEEKKKETAKKSDSSEQSRGAVGPDPDLPLDSLSLDIPSLDSHADFDPESENFASVLAEALVEHHDNNLEQIAKTLETIITAHCSNIRSRICRQTGMVDPKKLTDLIKTYPCDLRSLKIVPTTGLNHTVLFIKYLSKMAFFKLVKSKTF